MGEVVHDPDEKIKKDSTENNDLSSSEVAVYRWLHSLQWKGLGDPDAHACLTGKCGETIEIFLNFNGERVKEAAYLTNGCISSRVCSALIAQMANGKTPDELLEITAQSILSLLGEFPKSEEHCAFLAAETLQEALHNYMLKQSKDHSGEDLEP
jgi:nitrogen fixation NifU-like protein